MSGSTLFVRPGVPHTRLCRVNSRSAAIALAGQLHDANFTNCCLVAASMDEACNMIHLNVIPAPVSAFGTQEQQDELMARILMVTVATGGSRMLLFDLRPPATYRATKNFSVNLAAKCRCLNVQLDDFFVKGVDHEIFSFVEQYPDMFDRSYPSLERFSRPRETNHMSEFRSTLKSSFGPLEKDIWPAAPSDRLKTVHRHVGRLIADRCQEHLAVIHLDARDNPICLQMASIGDTNTTIVPTLVILRTALLAGASAITIMHNHPTGRLKPSGADVQVTERLASSANIIGLALREHFVVVPDNNRKLRFASRRVPCSHTPGL